LAERHAAERGASGELGDASREIVALEMTFGRLRADARPLDEKEERSPLACGITRFLAHDLDAVRESIAAFERGRPVVDGHVAADRRLVALGMIGRPVPRV